MRKIGSKKFFRKKWALPLKKKRPFFKNHTWKITGVFYFVIVDENVEFNELDDFD